MRTDPLDLNPDFPGDYLRYLSTFTKSEAFLLNLFSSKQFNLVYPLPDLSTSIVLTVHINQLMSQMVRTYHLYVGVRKLFINAELCILWESSVDPRVEKELSHYHSTQVGVKFLSKQVFQLTAPHYEKFDAARNFIKWGLSSMSKRHGVCKCVGGGKMYAHVLR